MGGIKWKVSGKLAESSGKSVRMSGIKWKWVESSRKRVKEDGSGWTRVESARKVYRTR